MPEYLSVISAIVAVVSLIFAWKAVKTSEKNNEIALIAVETAKKNNEIALTAIKTSEKNNEIASKAVKSAERNNAIALFVQLQNMYQSDDSFRSTKLVWEIYKKYQSNADGTPISFHDALKFVQDTDRASAEWNAVHVASTFWRHLALLTRLKYIDEEIVFEAFTSPRILGFLHPVEKAFLDFENQTYDYERSLKWLYNRWQERGRTGAED